MQEQLTGFWFNHFNVLPQKSHIGAQQAAPRKTVLLPPGTPVLYSFRRCPYAMRARLALRVSGQVYAHREVALKDKPPEMLALSPKGTVPVLCLAHGEVLEESLDIMAWALAQSDPEGWLAQGSPAEAQALIALNDGPFKHLLDRYKYANRHPEFTAAQYRQQAVDLHIGPLDAHLLNYRPMGFYASSDRITITVKGKQTHGARPWAGIDMASIAADIVQAMNQIAARQVDVGASPSVVTIATIHMGMRQNIIPEDLVMGGTMRTFSTERRADLIDRVQKSVAAIGDRYGAKAEAVFSQPYPVTYNDPALSSWVKASLEKASPGKVEDQGALVTGAEDFSMYAQKVPGVFVQLGGRPAGVPAAGAPANHSPYFDVDEAVFETGVKAEVFMALDYLEKK